jgi:hypothetical protein
MKKIFLTIFMVVWANGMFAQTFDEVNEVNSAEVAPTSEKPVPEPASSFEKEEMMRMWAMFQQYAIAAQRDTTPIVTSLPIIGRCKFARHNYITQRLEISLIGGKDGDLDEGRTRGTAAGGDDDDQNGDDNAMNFGLNVGYSIVIVPGRIKGDRLELNRLGWGYSVGIIASFDHQNDYGTTCDFLAKIGVEAGNGHKMGIGFDALIGSGKTAGDYIIISPEDNSYIELPYTAWCFKYGAQLWVRSSLLHASIKDTDIRLFARYVYSKNPEDEFEVIQSGVIPQWKEESWSFGLTFCYNF